MKKTYRKPTAKCIAMDGADAILFSISDTSNSGLGVGFGGNTSTQSIEEADTKEFSGKNLWDNEW